MRTWIPAGALVLTSALSLSACDSNVMVGDGTGSGTAGTAGTGAGTSTGTGAGGGLPGPKVNKIDILLDVDNSSSMADKQDLLALMVADLTNALINPLCVDANSLPSAQQPASPLDPCPPGSEREHQPIHDIHIGVISSSIGSAGANTCIQSGAKSGTVDDHGHLLARLVPDQPSLVPTYNDEGFLAWDPAQSNMPPGEANAQALVQNLQDMVLGVGQVGCGYEAQLESWYRFLVDTEPYQTIEVLPNDNGKPMATPLGTDTELLKQRADFLRPDSLLVIVSLSDENDCSIREEGQYYIAAQTEPGGFHLPPGRSECEANPNDPCCASCGQNPTGCLPSADDPKCAIGLDGTSDSSNQRCWDQKRRFGIDFLYPVDRYTTALTSPNIANRAGNLVPNPIFSDLDPTDDNTTIRDPGLVVMAGIVGVPWQDIARDPTDLAKGFKNAEELAAVDGGHTRWDVILGDPATNTPPLDPHMLETDKVRTGTNPITGDAIAGPTAPAGTNPINGHEFSIPGHDDLQYACIFDLLPGTEKNCAVGGGNCDCGSKTNDNPLCEPNPNDPTDPGSPTLQVRAKAYPGRRELSVLKGIGEGAVVTSICPHQVTDPTAPDFGYRSAAAAVHERMKKRLAAQGEL